MESVTSAHRVHIVSDPVVTETDPLLPKHKDISKESTKQEGALESNQAQPIEMPNFFKRCWIKISTYFSFTVTDSLSKISEQFSTEFTLFDREIEPRNLATLNRDIQKFSDLKCKWDELDVKIQTMVKDTQEYDDVDAQKKEIQKQIKPLHRRLRNDRRVRYSTSKERYTLDYTYNRTSNLYRAVSENILAVRNEYPELSDKEVLVLATPLGISKRQWKSLANFFNEVRDPQGTFASATLSPDVPKSEGAKTVSWPENGVMGEQISIPNNNRGRRARNNNRPVDRRVSFNAKPELKKWASKTIPEKGILKR